MSDGDGKESVKVLSERDCVKSGKKKSRGDDFSLAIAKIAMAQVCEGLGFQGFQQSALDTLADVGVRYIRDIGRTASLRAESSNRRECNVFDVIQGLEDLGSVQGFLGAADVSHPITGSGVVRDLMRYVGEAEEIPFAYLVPGFPVVKERRLNPSFAQVEENPPDEHIPNWLPKFPDSETYTELDLENKKNSDVDDKVQPAEVQDRQVDIPTENLQQAMVRNGSEAGIAVEQGGVAMANRATDINPFLAPPLQYGEKEVHVPVLPPKLLEETTGFHQSHAVMENHVSVSALEPTVPTNEADDRRRLLLNGRPKVQFKFGNAKKPLGTRCISENEGFKKISTIWFADDHGGKDEMKRKAEHIFREKMEYSQEVSQL